MSTMQGIAVGASVAVEGHCRVSCDVIGDQVQFEFGHLGGALHLTITEQDLVTLVEVATATLARLQVGDRSDQVVRLTSETYNSAAPRIELR